MSCRSFRRPESALEQLPCKEQRAQSDEACPGPFALVAIQCLEIRVFRVGVRSHHNDVVVAEPHVCSLLVYVRIWNWREHGNDKHRHTGKSNPVDEAQLERRSNWAVVLQILEGIHSRTVS